MEKFIIPESKCQRLGKDSDVLKIFHKEMLESEGNGSKSLFPGFTGCGSVLGKGHTVSAAVGDSLDGTSAAVRVDDSRATYLDVVASNLREAMEVALE